MSWSEQELRTLGETDEIGVAASRSDGRLRPYTTIWCVPVGDAVYIRSAYGPNSVWYRHAVARGVGSIRWGEDAAEVTFTRIDPADSVHAEIDAASHAAYDRYGPQIVGTVVGPAAAEVTLRVDRTD